MRPRINAFIRRQVSEGHQVFVVCPAVEDSEENDLKSVELWAETLQKTVFPDLRVGLLHGRMKGTEKDETMDTITNAPIQSCSAPYPGMPLLLGSKGKNVLYLQIVLSGIAVFYPEIPVLSPVDGEFGPAMSAPLP